MFGSNLLVKHGLKPNDVAIIGVGATGGTVAAMKRGEIDAISNLDPEILLMDELNTVFAGILVLTGFALLLDAVVTFAERRLLVWRPTAAGSESL